MNRSFFGPRFFVLGPLLLSLLPACGSSDSSGGTQQPAVGFNAKAVADLEAAGLSKYMGKAKPSAPTDQASGAKTYSFDKADGPICLWGGPFSASIRDTGSENLVIYLQGGGACWTGFCAANTTADPNLPEVGVLDDKATTTNVVADWNVVYVPYCDGSVFSGDNEVTVSGANLGPAGETTRYHHGLENLTAALDLAKAHFPSPKRIVLAGSSAGGFGTIIGTAVVRLEYPTTPLIVFNDAGVGLHPTGTAFQTILSEWKIDQFIPASCTGCTDDTTAVIAWGLRNDPSLRAAGFSSYADSVISTFIGIQGAAFKTLLLDRTGAVHTEFPDRFKRFLVNGSEHTTLILNANNTPGSGIGGYYDEFDGIKIADWTRAFVDDSAGWVEHLQ